MGTYRTKVRKTLDTTNVVIKVSSIVTDPPNSFGGFDEFTAALRKIKTLGFQGVEFGLTHPLGFQQPFLAGAGWSFRHTRMSRGNIQATGITEINMTVR